MRRLIGAMVVSSGLLAAGCGGDSGTAPATSGGAPAAAPAAGTATATGGAIGIKECDDYFARVEACLPKMPESARGAVATALANQREGFKRTAATTDGRAALPETCKALLANVEKNPACRM